MENIEGASSYQNQYGNIGGEGNYAGIKVSDLIELAGGMDEGDVLRVEATDGYYQDFGYLNVYPDEAYLSVQGTMILALEYDTVGIPKWQDGPRIVMLAADGLYSNDDCDQTSYENQIDDSYLSAGARWVKNVVKLTIME